MTAAPNSPMVGYVAIALCSWLNGQKRHLPPEQIWDGLSDRLKNAYREQAKAALAAYEAEAMMAALRRAEEALRRSYNAQEWPADGTSLQEVTAAEIRALLTRLDAKPTEKIP